jgi:hypothetical protein
MKKIIYTLLAVVACAPAVAGAYTIQSSTVSSSQTGGVTANAGENISTGSSDASAEIHTTITGNSNGGTADVEIYTEDNGVSKTETHHYDIPPSNTIVVEASSSSGTHAGIPVGTSTVRAHVWSSVASSSASSTPPVVHGLKTRIFSRLSSFFHSFFSWFGR